MRSFSFTFLALCGLSLVSFSPSAAWGQAARASVNEAIPIAVNADTMAYEPEKDRVVFRGNVEVTRGAFVMWAQQLTLHMKPVAAPPARSSEGASEGTSGQGTGQGTGRAPDQGASQADDMAAPLLEPGLDPGALDRIVAEKNVRFRYNTQSGTASRATYTLATGVLVLDGDPTLRDGENSISGNVIRYFLHENRSEVDSGPQRRVEAVFGAGALPAGD